MAASVLPRKPRRRRRPPRHTSRRWRSAIATASDAVTAASGLGWPTDAAALVAEQERLAELDPPLWFPGPHEPAVGGCFVAYRPGEAGPGRPGDRAWVGAAVVIAGEV